MTDRQDKHVRRTRGAQWASFVRALRPHQWAKNVLVFVPFIAAHQFLDPRYNPVVFYPLKRRLKALLQRLGRRPLGVLPDLHYPAQFDRLVAGAGLEKRKSRSVGFGEFTFLGARLLPDAGSVALHRRLQRLADRGIPFLRRAGMNYMVLATRPVFPGARPDRHASR